jgi:hypothetical protein
MLMMMRIPCPLSCFFYRRKSENSAEEVARIESSILDALLEDCFLHNDDDGDGELTLGEFSKWAGATESLGTILKHLHLRNY